MARSLQTNYGIPAEQAGANRSFTNSETLKPQRPRRITEVIRDLSLNFPRSRHFAGMFDSTNCLGYRVVDAVKDVLVFVVDQP